MQITRDVGGQWQQWNESELEDNVQHPEVLDVAMNKILNFPRFNGFYENWKIEVRCRIIHSNLPDHSSLSVFKIIHFALRNAFGAMEVPK